MKLRKRYRIRLRHLTQVFSRFCRMLRTRSRRLKTGGRSMMGCLGMGRVMGLLANCKNSFFKLLNLSVKLVRWKKSLRFIKKMRNGSKVATDILSSANSTERRTLLKIYPKSLKI